ncbi:DUF2512 family protein [Aneurinibacillus migulanus]|uniref:DUF2512 family protein n=1 Tax=Aneurinibacillus migulanus TaxID=47500 RepID=UPI000A7CE4FD|nr:DUF2512 family protein [Aneurinibacillus migulanus]
MTTLVIKIIMCPLAVILSSYLFPDVNYSATYQPIIVGLILAVVGTIMEYIFLREGTLWISTGLDFVASFFVVYFVSLLFTGTTVTITGALATSLIVAATEFFTHQYLINSGKTRKVPS